jgi:serine/threonine protein kinase
MMRDGPELVVHGRWHCETRIVDGPHGTLWRAWDERLRRMVALRIVHAPLIGDPQVRRRIDKLLSVTAELQNDNMAYLYDVFEEEGLGVVLISEFVEGPTLSEIRDHLAPMEIAAVAAIGVQLAEGVAAIHAAGVAHRDLGPDNVRITADGTVKITGFSAARLLTDSTATPAGGLEEERTYLAPEQLAGGASDRRSDIYALGLLLWELAVGAHPFEVAHAAQAGITGTRGEVPPLSVVRDDVPASLSEAVEIATRRDPVDRWPDAQSFGERLQVLCPGRPRFVVRDLIALHQPADSTP